MEWIPVVLITFKLLVFGIGMFYAIKWHRDQEKLRAQGRTGTSQAGTPVHRTTPPAPTIEGRTDLPDPPPPPG